MKFKSRTLRLYNNSGIIMIVALWTMIILTLLAVGLGRKASLDLSLTRYAIGKVKSDYALWAGLFYAMEQIRKDTDSPQTDKYDTLFECGFAKEEKLPRDLFQKIPLEGAEFTIGNKFLGSSEKDDICYGFSDEERWINLNSVFASNYRFLSHLLILLGLDQETADTLSANISDWQDSDNIKTADKGAEGDDYQALMGYAIKNRPFDTPDELLLVKGIDKDIYEKLRPLVTVFPRRPTQIDLNINTAPEVILKAFFRWASERNPNADDSDADGLAEKIIQYRSGPDGRACTADDQLIEKNNIALLGFNQTEEAIFLTAANNITETSFYFRVSIMAEDTLSGISSSAKAIISRESLAVLFWSRK